MTENEVVDYIEKWLRGIGCTINGTCRNTARGDDVAAVLPDGSELFVECKGSISRQGNELDSWHNSAMAMFGAIKDTEEFRSTKNHAIAIPDTAAYRKAIGELNTFFIRQRIAVFWVGANGHVLCEGAPNKAFQRAFEGSRR